MAINYLPTMDTTSTNTFRADTPAIQQMLRRFRSPWLMRLYFLRRLPSLALWGVRIHEIDGDRCVIKLPYGWRSQNPFRSTYFAAQSGAAELSSGLLAMLGIAGRGRVSMLVTRVSSTFTKKADQAAYFECTDGPRLREAIQRALDTGEGQTVTVLSTGRLKDGTDVSQTEITWSFKQKSGN